MKGRRWLRWQFVGMFWIQGALALALLAVTIYHGQAMRTYDHTAELRTARATCQMLAYVVSELSGEETTARFEHRGTRCTMRLSSGLVLEWHWEESESTWRLHRLEL